MNSGKRTCKILKEIRKRIAEENDIEFITSECTYRGNCAGTCPKCEAEVQYLCEQLDARRQMGKAVMLTGISVGMLASSVGLTSCGQGIAEKTDADTTKIEKMVMPGEIINDSIGLDTIETANVNNEQEAIQALNTTKVTELLVAGNPAPMVKGVYELDNEDEAKFPGGDKALFDYISRELQKIDFKNHLGFGIEAWLVIDINGKVKSIHKRGYSCATNYWDKVDSILMNIPAFTPGMYEGKVVDSWYLVYGFWKAKDKTESMEIEESEVDTIYNKGINDTIE